MMWRMVKNKNKTLGFDSYTIEIFNEEFTPGINIDKNGLTPAMNISVFEVLDSIPTEYVREYLDYIDKERKARSF